MKHLGTLVDSGFITVGKKTLFLKHTPEGIEFHKPTQQEVKLLLATAAKSPTHQRVELKCD